MRKLDHGPAAPKIARPSIHPNPSSRFRRTSIAPPTDDSQITQHRIPTLKSDRLLARDGSHDGDRAKPQLHQKERPYMSKIHDGNDTRGTLPALGARQASAKIGEAASPSEPFVLMDALATSDAGQLLMIQYVDVGAASEDWERVVLVKGIEAEYSLAHSSTIRISSPHRFQDLGETLIRDEQEGRAQNRTDEFEKKEYVAERREQEEALHQAVDGLGC